MYDRTNPPLAQRPRVWYDEKKTYRKGMVTVYQATELQMALSVSRIVTIHYFEYTSSYSYEGEAHPFWEFLYVDKGEVDVIGGERHYSLKKGQIIFHKPGEFHRLWANGEVAPNLVVVSFECDSPAMHFFEDQVLSVGDVERDCMAAIVSEAQNAFSTPLNDPDTQLLERREQIPFAAEQVIRLNLEWMLIHLCRTVQTGEEETAAEVHRPGSLIRENNQKDFMDKVTAYLEANLHRRLTLEDVCRENLVGRSYLQKIFREKTGGGVMEYFGRQKVERARQMIRQGRCNFTEISAALGYTSIHYFSRHFKKVTGMTPSEYASSVKILTAKK